MCSFLLFSNHNKWWVFPNQWFGFHLRWLFPNYVSSLEFLLSFSLCSDGPEFVMKPGNVSGDVGEEVVLQCEAESHPAPSYKWFRNGNLDMVIIMIITIVKITLNLNCCCYQH